MSSTATEVELIDTLSSIPEIPRPPVPSADIGIGSIVLRSHDTSGQLPHTGKIDVFSLSPTASLELLCRSLDDLVRLTNDPLLTPSSSNQSIPSLRALRAEKENVALEPISSACQTPSGTVDDLDGGPPPAKSTTRSFDDLQAESLHVVKTNIKTLRNQHDAIARKFYSKKIPPIGLDEYLFRLHRYCPMSTAVYLATSLYIYRLAIVEQIIPITAKNVHRLVLAGLRVTMKALEDQSYPHRRFAKVGGVTEPELKRLEISFCFITNFAFCVDKEILSEHAEGIRDKTFSYQELNGGQRQIRSSRNGIHPIGEVAKAPGPVVVEAPTVA